MQFKKIIEFLRTLLIFPYQTKMIKIIIIYKYFMLVLVSVAGRNRYKKHKLFINF